LTELTKGRAEQIAKGTSVQSSWGRDPGQAPFVGFISTVFVMVVLLFLIATIKEMKDISYVGARTPIEQPAIQDCWIRTATPTWVRDRAVQVIFAIIVINASITACAKTIRRHSDENGIDASDNYPIGNDTGVNTNDQRFVDRHTDFNSTDQWCSPPSLNNTPYTPWGDNSILIDRNCNHREDEYIVDLSTCSETSLRCSLGEGLFIDKCGCGCTLFRSNYSMSQGRYESAVIPIREVKPEVDILTECNGPSGYLVAFTHTSHFYYMVMQEADILIWVGSNRGTAWRVAKTTGGLTFVPTLNVDFFQQAQLNSPITSAGFVAHHRSRPCGGGDNFIYDTKDGRLIRRPQGALAEEGEKDLFEFPQTGGTSVYLVSGSDFYATGELGDLWHAKVWPKPTEPVLVEDRGAWDDDDYSSLIGIDHDAVYWTAGASPDRRASSGGVPLALYRTCRP